MKRITSSLLFTASVLCALAQPGNNNCVYSAIYSYTVEQGGPADLERGLKCSDEASVHETTAPLSKTWSYRAQLYALAFGDSVLSKKYNNTGFEAVKAFQHLSNLNDPKFKTWSELENMVYALESRMFNTGVDEFQAKNYPAAYKYFYSIKDLDSVISRRLKVPTATYISYLQLIPGNTTLEEAKKILALPATQITDSKSQGTETYTFSEKAGVVTLVFKNGRLFEKSQLGISKAIDVTVALKNAAIAAENAGLSEDAIKVYRDWLAVVPDPLAYRNLAAAYKKLGRKEESNKSLDEGLSRYPKDATLLVEKINVFLADTNYTAALAFINNLLEVEPNNDGALFVKASAYDKIGNEDSVIYYYSKSAEINPNNVDVWNNLAEVWVDKANALVEKMNKLGTSAADTKKYDELKKLRKEYYLKAKPYLEKAVELDKTNEKLNRVLKQVQIYTNE